MRLRNKKTRKVLRVGEDVYIRSLDSGSIEVREDFGCGNKIEYFKTFAKMFERYEEVKEPLIKDEKVRKVVRAWAEAIDLRWFKRCVSVSPHTSRLYGQDARGIGYTIELKPSELYGDLIDKKGYTLAELCGEGE